MVRRNWSENELLQLLRIYCELPFGKMDSRNPEIVALAGRIGRTPGAIAMKMVNFASLDPTIPAKGMSNVSKLDREVWKKFFANIDRYLSSPDSSEEGFDENPQEIFVPTDDFSADDIVVAATARRGQQAFRRIVLASYESRCAISGLNDRRLLIASHIAPWASLKNRRIDPRNGICLNALWDKAFDRGLVSLTDNLDLIFSDKLSHLTREKLESTGSRFQPPSKFGPDMELLAAHRKRFGFGG